MIYHKPCNFIIKIDISEVVKILADFSIMGKFTAQATTLTFHRLTNKKIPIIYYCKKCNKNVDDFDEMVSPCDSCGKIFSSISIKIPQDSGGLYCSNCIKRFSDEKCYSISIKDIKIGV